MCLDDVVMAFYRRVFHMPRRRHHCAAGSGEQLNTRSSCDSVVVADDSDSARLDFDIRRDKETRSVELGDVVLDAETFQQMIDELKTLKLTILRLQTMLLQICTGESGLHNNDIVDANGSVRVQHSPERHELRKRVNELEKLVWEQRKIIDGLKQTSVELETVSITPEIGAATSEAETELAFTFRENCCTTDNVNEPSLYVSCSSDVTSSVDIASSTREHFQLVNGGIEKQNMSTGHHFASSPVILSNDKHNIICNYQYPTNDNAVLGSSSGDALKSSCNSIDVQPEIKPGYGHKKSSSQRTFATKTEKNFVRQRTRSEEESTIDCSMFDYDGAVDSDHELNLGEPIECKHSSQMGNNSDFITRVLNSVIEQGTTGSEVACNQQRLGEHLENVTDFHSHLSDGSYGKFNLDQQGNIGLDFSMSENSIVSNTTRLITEAEEEVDSNNSRSLIQMLKSYSTAAAERKVKRLDNSVSASTPIREVCNSLPNTANTAQPKSASLHKATKQSREICTSRLPSSNASKLPAPIAK